VGIADLLSGGDPRSLGTVNEAIRIALSDRARLGELLECLFCADPVVRMRAADALEKVARQSPELLAPLIPRLLDDVAAIEQPSVQWHLAQMLAEVRLDAAQRRRAVAILKRNLESSDATSRARMTGSCSPSRWTR
jgi:hypothetical protein